MVLHNRICSGVVDIEAALISGRESLEAWSPMLQHLRQTFRGDRRPSRHLKAESL